MSHIIDKEEGWFNKWFQFMATTMSTSIDQNGSAFEDSNINTMNRLDHEPKIHCTTNLYQNENFPLLYIQKNPGLFRDQKLYFRIDMTLRTAYEGGNVESVCLMKIRKTMDKPYQDQLGKTHTRFQPKSFAYKVTDKKIREVLLSYDAIVDFRELKKQNSEMISFSELPEKHVRLYLQEPDPWNQESGRNKEASILPLSSALHCTQTLFTAPPTPAGERYFSPVSSQLASYRLDENGDAHKKYHVLIQCEGHSPPVFSKLWPDQVVWVYSAIRMRESVTANMPLITRNTPVPGSIIFHDEKEQEHALHDTAWNKQDKTITHTQSGLISYIPIMRMKVQKMTVSCKEPDATSSWGLELYES